MSEFGSQEIPAEILEQYEFTPIYCTECELPITVSLNDADEQPVRWECSCKTISPSQRPPERWVVSSGGDTDV